MSAWWPMVGDVPDWTSPSAAPTGAPGTGWHSAQAHFGNGATPLLGPVAGTLYRVWVWGQTVFSGTGIVHVLVTGSAAIQSQTLGTPWIDSINFAQEASSGRPGGIAVPTLLVFATTASTKGLTLYVLYSVVTV